VNDDDANGQSGQGPLRPDERAELERLRAEVAELRGSVPGEAAAAAPPAPAARARRYTVGAVLVLVVACLLAPVSVVAVWAKSQVFDTDRYVQTVAPLAEDAAVQRMVTQRITAGIFSRIDVEGLTSEAIAALRSTLPADVGQNLQALSGLVADGVQRAVRDQIGNVVASDTFADAWAEANRAAHDQLVATLSGQGGAALQIEGTTVSVQLAPFANAVKQRLVDRGFALAERIPSINAKFVILRSSDLPRIQRGFDLLNTLGLWLPLLTLGLFVIGVSLARDHRLALVGGGLGLALSMLLVGIGLAVARLAYLDAIPARVMPPDAATVIYDTIVRFLREGIRAVGLGALVVSVGAFLLGPSRAATAVRQQATAGAAAGSRVLASLGVQTVPVSQRVAPHTHGVRIALVLVAFLAFLLPAYPTPALVVLIAVGLLAALLVLQVLSTPGTGTTGRATGP
jgi:hypothetical protein